MAITLVGLDAVNLSLGLALKAVVPELEIVGNDRDRERVKAASKLGAIDKGHWNLLNACDGADIVILSEPLPQLETDLAALASELPAETVLVVHSATQRPIEALRSRLGGRAPIVGVRFVAAGLGAGAAPDGKLLDGALCYVIAAADTPPEAMQAATYLAEAVGAKPCYLNDAEHDGLAAATTQLPQMLALSLLTSLAQSGAQRDLGRDLSSILSALGRYALAAEEIDALLANSDNLPHWLDACADELRRLAGCLATQDRAGIEAAANTARQALAEWSKPEGETAKEMPQTPAWRQLLLGTRPRRRS
ncbi:MAG: prephenate dehydrogenase/arogenate dehydrogenase family protein [Anaerolineales bacterium]